MNTSTRTSDGMAALITLGAGTLALALVVGLIGSFARPAVLADASMEPALPQGALLLIESRGSEELRAGDVVSIRTADGTVTRRVIAVDTISAGTLATIKADAASAPESWGVMYAGQADVVGGAVPILGYVAENAWVAAGGIVFLVAVAAGTLWAIRRRRRTPAPVQWDETIAVRLPADARPAKTPPMKAAL